MPRRHDDLSLIEDGMVRKPHLLRRLAVIACLCIAALLLHTVLHGPVAKLSVTVVDW
jgi:hypothetical protein